MLQLFSKAIFAFLFFALLSNKSYADPIPNVTAQAWLVADSSGNIISGTNIDDIRSIASITKLMTTMVVLDASQDLAEIIPKKLYNKKLTRADLIDLAIVKSDNNAAKMLCDYYPSGYKNCIQAMNDKAKELNMLNTVFTDPTGILHSNISTANDLIKLVMAASTYEVIRHSSNKNSITYSAGKKNTVTFNNTNTLVGKGYEFIVSKTGYVSKAGGCIVFMTETAKGIRTVILLGSKNTKTRIPEAHLISTLY